MAAPRQTHGEVTREAGWPTPAQAKPRRPSMAAQVAFRSGGTYTMDAAAQPAIRKQTSSIAGVARRVSGISVERAARLHTELRESVCARRMVVLLLVVALLSSASVPLVQSMYRDSVSLEATELTIKGTAASALAELQSALASKHVHTVLSYAMDGGWLRGPMDIERFESVTAPLFVQEPDMLELHMVHTSKDSLVFRRDDAGHFVSESRWYRSDDLQERQSRARSATADVTTFVESPVTARPYDPTTELWYQRMAVHDPTSMGLQHHESWSYDVERKANGKVMPVLWMVSHHPWPEAVGGEAVVSVKFRAAAIARRLAGLDVGVRGNTYVVSSNGDVIAAGGGSVHGVSSGAELAKVWDLAAEAGLVSITPEALASGADSLLYEHDSEMVYVVPIGVDDFHLVVALHVDDFLSGLRDVSTIAALLSAASISVLIANLVKMVSGLVLLAAHRHEERKKRREAAERLRKYALAASREVAASGGVTSPTGDIAQGKRGKAPYFAFKHQTRSSSCDSDGAAKGGLSTRPGTRPSVVIDAPAPFLFDSDGLSDQERYQLDQFARAVSSDSTHEPPRMRGVTAAHSFDTVGEDEAEDDVDSLDAFATTADSFEIIVNGPAGTAPVLTPLADGCRHRARSTKAAASRVYASAVPQGSLSPVAAYPAGDTGAGAGAGTSTSSGTRQQARSNGAGGMPPRSPGVATGSRCGSIASLDSIVNRSAWVPGLGATWTPTYRTTRGAAAAQRGDSQALAAARSHMTASPSSTSGTGVPSSQR